MATLLEARDVTKRYGPADSGHLALDCVNLSLEGGRIYGLLGPNGAGKTTFLRICSTLLAPTTGDVWVDSHHTVQAPESVRSRLGFLSASTSVYERLTPTELMRYFGKLHGLSADAIERNTEQIFSSLEIHAYRDRTIGKLSTGMRQKVSIARAFVHQPPVLILDEPTNGLDVVVRQSLLDMLREYRREDRLLVISTHDLPEAQELCDAYVFLSEGRVIADASQAELFDPTQTSLRETFFRALSEPHAGKEA